MQKTPSWERRWRRWRRDSRQSGAETNTTQRWSSDSFRAQSTCCKLSPDAAAIHLIASACHPSSQSFFSLRPLSTSVPLCAMMDSLLWFHRLERIALVEVVEKQLTGQRRAQQRFRHSYDPCVLRAQGLGMLASIGAGEQSYNVCQHTAYSCGSCSGAVQRPLIRLINVCTQRWACSCSTPPTRELGRSTRRSAQYTAADTSALQPPSPCHPLIAWSAVFFSLSPVFFT
jgi:hypothetical protein